jgi:hypothetical protein
MLSPLIAPHCRVSLYVSLPADHLGLRYHLNFNVESIG